MKRMIMFLVLLLTLTVSVSAAPSPVSRQTVTSCSGTGELLLYNGNDPFKIEEDITFTTSYDEMLVMTRPKYYTWIKVKVDGNLKTLNEYWKGVFPAVPFDVTVFSVNTTSGTLVDFEAKVYDNAVRGIQAFILQDPDQPFFNDEFDVIYDDLGTSTAYFYPGTYNHIVFDRYSYNSLRDSQLNRPDTRKTTVTVKDSADNVVFTKTYVGPNPVGTQGVNVAEFTIVTEGYYTISVDSEDSVYWGVTPCEPDNNEVPEFGVIGAGLVVVGALGFLIFRKK